VPLRWSGRWVTPEQLVESSVEKERRILAIMEDIKGLLERTW
jgi:hypothetical protein